MKQMAYSAGVTEESLIRGLFTKGVGRVQELLRTAKLLTAAKQGVRTNPQLVRTGLGVVIKP